MSDLRPGIIRFAAAMEAKMRLRDKRNKHVRTRAIALCKFAEELMEVLAELEKTPQELERVKEEMTDVAICAMLYWNDGMSLE